MPIYNYSAIKNGKDIINGRIEAASPREARDLIKALKLIPTKIYIEEYQKSADEAKKPSVQKIRIKKLKMREKIDFTNTLKILIRTGVPIIEGLIFIENNVDTKNIQQLSKALRKQIIAGSSFSDTVGSYPEVFDRVYTGLVSAGEASGELDLTLERMSELLAKQDNIKNKVVGTLIYPAFVIVLAMLVVTVMLTFVFPAFRDMYANMGKKLPWITQACMDAGIFMKTYWFVIPIGFGGFFYSNYFIMKWPPSRRKIDEFILKVPVFSSFVKLAALSNFIAVMNVAYEASIPIVDCIYLSNLTVHNYPLRDALKNVATKVQQGTHLSAALKTSKLIPPILLFMISTGEQSGRLGEMLQHASRYIDEELERTIDKLTKLIEPFMLIFIGGIILVLALALYMPLFTAYSNMT